MSNRLVVTSEKPMRHLSLSDWHGRLIHLKSISDTAQQNSFDQRFLSKTLQNETRIQSEWEAYNSNNLLANRISDINSWRIIIEKLLERIEREMKLLRDEKLETENELETMITAMVINSECLTMRDSRLGDELTNDEADKELKYELQILENNQKLLKDQCQLTWNKLNRLEDVKFKLTLEISNKIEAENIDVAQLELNKSSANITYKPDPTRIPKYSITYEAWLEHTRNIKEMSENELADIYTIRESLFVSREKARNILKAQQEKTDHIIRKRIFETQRARNELEWMKLKINEEMEKCMNEIKRLEQALHEKANNLKLAETRLENRAQRSGKELVIDQPHKGLCNEVKELRKIKECLSKQIDRIKECYNALESNALRIDQDLNNKQHSLMTDIRALDLRQRLKKDKVLSTCNEKESQTERNIKLTGMEEEIPA